MKKYVLLIVFFLGTTLPALAQTEEAYHSVNEGTIIGVGGYNLKDTYLSPGEDMKYGGWGLRVLNERMKLLKLADGQISRQQIFSVDVATSTNPASTANNLAGFVDYTLAYHYRFQVLPELKILTGASAHGMLGFIYNTRNGNNPASAKMDIDLNISALAIYSFQIKDYPLTIRYQMEIPFSGVLFSPHKLQSYYEIFSQGNTSGIIKYNSFHNKFAIKNYLTIDFPIASYTVRAGYLGSYYYTDVNDIQSHIISNSFMIGIVKEFVSFGGKRAQRNANKLNSAYY